MNSVLKALWYLDGSLILVIQNSGFMVGVIQTLWFLSGLLMLFFMYKRKVKVGLEGILIFFLGPVSWSVVLALIAHRKFRPNDTTVIASLLVLFILICWAALLVWFTTFISK